MLCKVQAEQPLFRTATRQWSGIEVGGAIDMQGGVGLLEQGNLRRAEDIEACFGGVESSADKPPE